MSCSLQQYTSNVGSVKISTANPNRDGTGTLGSVITGASNGTFIKTITIAAEASTTQGMVRLFIDNGTKFLFKEIAIPASTPTSTVPSFKVILSGRFYLASGVELKASTENAEVFAITADGLDMTNCGCPG